MEPEPADPGIPTIPTQMTLAHWRAEFPIVDTCTYLVSHSLGAMPKRARRRTCRSSPTTWSSRGVRAWHEGWWEMGRTTGDLLAPILGVAARHDLDAPERHGRAGDHRVVLHRTTGRAARSS